MKPRLLNFRDLQDELRNLAKETKKFQSKSKKTYAQVQVASECNSDVKPEKVKHTEWSELTELVPPCCKEHLCVKVSEIWPVTITISRIFYFHLMLFVLLYCLLFFSHSFTCACSVFSFLFFFCIPEERGNVPTKRRMIGRM